MNEAQTRLDLIDPAIKKAGWGVVANSRIIVEKQITDGRILGVDNKKKRVRSKQLIADYVLRFNNINLAIIEAKAKDKSYTEGVAQAKDYAKRLQIRFAYATNGTRIYEIDMQEGKEKEVSAYPTPQQLWERTFTKPETENEKEIANWKERLNSIPFQLVGGKWQPRYYQQNAINAVINGIAENKKRLLLTMATGTGKTGTAFQICWKLYEAKWTLKRNAYRSPRILFLADRNILADQAFNSFSNAFDEDALIRITPAEIKKQGQVPKNGNIFFTIFQSFMSSASSNTEENESEDFETENPYYKDYERDFFDFIIIDECHRGGAKDESTWRGILEYFEPAVQLGLTATPKRKVNADTYYYFGKPVYEYSLKDGINDGFLTPFKVREISTTIDNYTYLGTDKVVAGEPEENTTYTEKDFNNTITIPEREQYRIRLFMDEINQDHKTLVFCATQDHALAVRDYINQYSQSKNPDYCHRVTANDGALGEQHLRDFQDNEKKIPTILTTSKKLSTGVDAPEVKNIVLMRPVKSMVEFKQIVGRGTRLFEDKDYFTVFDFVEANKHFQDPEWDGEPLEPTEPTERIKKPCKKCGELQCLCPAPEEDENEDEEQPKGKIEISLSDGSVRALDSMSKTTFWDISGKPISAEQFIQQLFGEIPTFFESEAELIKIWSLPSTRKKLLQELEDKGYANTQLNDLRNLVNAQHSDLFDVLTYIAYNKDLLPRTERAEKAKISLQDYNQQQQQFLNFILEQYVQQGISELDDKKLPELIELKYNSLNDARNILGSVKDIRNLFINFQERLYKKKVG